MDHVPAHGQRDMRILAAEEAIIEDRRSGQSYDRNAEHSSSSPARLTHLLLRSRLCGAQYLLENALKVRRSGPPPLVRWESYPQNLPGFV